MDSLDPLMDSGSGQSAAAGSATRGDDGIDGGPGDVEMGSLGAVGGGASPLGGTFNALSGRAGKGVKSVRNFKSSAVSKTESCPRWAQCLMCCCCWTFTGMRELLTSGSTLEFALGFIVGEQFSAVIYALVEYAVAPLVLSMLDAGSIAVQAKPGYVIVTNPNGADVASAQDAIEQGCRIVNYDAFFQSFLSFLVVMLTVYWVMSVLERLAREAREEKRQIELVDMKECQFCMENMSKRATRCPHCTSHQSPDAHKHGSDGNRDSDSDSDLGGIGGGTGGSRGVGGGDATRMTDVDMA